MKGVRLDDTIVAISTGGMGAIGIVRMSGEDCIALADKIFKSKKNIYDRSLSGLDGKAIP